MPPKDRSEIPAEIAAKVLFRSNRTCCVCREPRKPVQIHHLDEDPSNGREDNLAVLCFDCHHETQIRGGFSRKLDSHQIILFRDDWYGLVNRNRGALDSPAESRQIPRTWVPGVMEVNLLGKLVHLGYLKLTEEDKQQRYKFDADYPQLTPDDSTVAGEANTCLTAFVTRELQRFRARATETSPGKAEMEKQFPDTALSWDSLSIGHSIGIFTPSILTIEFRIWSYGAGAAHSNTTTRTFNFLFQPSLQLEFVDILENGSKDIEAISQFCIAELHEMQPPSLKSQFPARTNDWILKGAGPDPSNFEKFLLEKGGMRIFFDPYSVACYAEGRYEVFLPLHVLSGHIKEPLLKQLN